MPSKPNRPSSNHLVSPKSPKPVFKFSEEMGKDEIELKIDKQEASEEAHSP